MIRSFSFAKPNESEDSNEDKIRVEKETLLAISDGAGGEGIGADLWAETILKHLPSLPFVSPSEINDWVGSFCDEFDTMLQPIISNNPTAQEKFYRQGALATLCAVWIEGNQLQYNIVGDSILMIYNPTSRSLWVANSDMPLLIFDENPFLISYQEATREDQILINKIELKEIDVIILATDSIAKLLIASFFTSYQPDFYQKQVSQIAQLSYRQYIDNFNQFLEKNPEFSFDQLLHQIQTLDDSNLKEYLYNLSNLGILSYDDYSGIVFSYSNVDSNL